jgi:hypothetical protein
MAEIDDLKKQIEDLNKRVASLGGDFYKDINQAIASFGGGIKGAEQALKGLQKEMNNVNTDVNYLYNALKNVTRELKGQTNSNKDIAASYSKISSIANQLKHDQDGISELNKKQLISAAKKIQIEKTSLENSIKANTQRKEEILGILQNKDAREKAGAQEVNRLRKEYTQIKANTAEAQAFYDDSENGIDSLAKATQKRLAEEIKIEKTLGLTGAAVDGIVGALGKLGISNTFFEDLKDNMKDAAKSGSSFKVMLTAASGLAKGIGQAITDPLTVMTFLISQGLKANKQVTDLGKALGVSYSEANKLRQEFVLYSRATNDSFVTTDRLIKAQSELSDQLGIAVKFSNEELATFSKLTEIVGLSAQEAGKLTSFSAAAGVSATEYVKQIRASSFAAQQANKVHFSDKQVLQDIAGLSSGILVKFQNNPKAIAAAVVQAKALGLTLQQVDKVGDSLLNWESSIENQLKAQLLTGKQLNLEKARYLALTGSQAELSQEISKQAGSLADFQNMNVIAQKSLAEAFGMSRDELADMLMKQEAINKYGSEANKLNAQQLKDFEKSGLSLDVYLKKQAEQLSAQENFNNAILKLQDLLAGIVSGPIGQLVGGFAQLVNHALVLKPIIGAIAGLVAGKMVMGIWDFGKGIVSALPKLATMVGLSSAKAVAEITAAEAITFGLATIGIVAGIASAVAAMNSAKSEASNTQNVSDGIAPSSKGPFTITDKFGATAVTTVGDGLAVSPNINRDSISRPMQPSFNTSAITDAIDVLSNTVSGLINRPQPTPQFALHVDGKQLGTVVGSQMETGTAQNIYTGYRMA